MKSLKVILELTLHQKPKGHLQLKDSFEMSNVKMFTKKTPKRKEPSTRQYHLVELQKIQMELLICCAIVFKLIEFNFKAYF